MASRIYHYAESTSDTSTTSSSDQTKATLTFTPQANSEYVYIWSAQVRSASTSADVRVNLKSGSTVIAESNIEDQDTTDWHPVSGLEHASFGSSPSSVTLTVNYSAESGNSARIREARILALKLEAGESYTENTGTVTNTTTTFSTALTINWTPASAGDYILMASCEYNFSVIDGDFRARIVHSGTNYSNLWARPRDTSNYMAGMHAVYLSNLSGAQTATLQFARSSNVSGTANCRRPALLVLRADNFPQVYQGATRALGSSTSTGYTVRGSTGAVTVQNYPHLILGVATRTHGNNTSSARTRLVEGANILVSNTEQENYGSNTDVDVPAGMWAQIDVYTPAAGSRTYSIEYATETAGVTTAIKEAAIFAIQLEEAAAPEAQVSWIELQAVQSEIKEIVQLYIID